MVNHFRTLLLNLSDVGTLSEHITKGFTARQLSGGPLSFYQMLFPTGSSRSRVLELGQAYLELIEATDLSEVITLQDPRVTYDLKSDFNNFKKPSFDLSLLFGKINSSNGVAESILALPKHGDTDTYDNIWKQHPNKAYKLAGLIAAHVIRLA